MPPRYEEWLAHVFEHEVSGKAWYFDTDAPDFHGSDEEITELITWTLNNSGSDLARFSDEKVNQGLNYIFNNSCSNLVFCIMDGQFEIEKKLEAVRSVGKLYHDCFAVRCDQVLLHRDEASSSKLNQICYMLWDTSPLSYWEGRADAALAYAAVIAVMEAALQSKNIACVESALHGLGHTYNKVPDRIAEVIRNFIAANPRMRPELLAYAKNAALGYVQ
jgi:hypothetical protein